MGLSASATLIYGIKIASHGDDSEPTRWWNDDEGDWIDLEDLWVAKDYPELTNPWSTLPAEVNTGGREVYEDWQDANPDWVASREAWYAARDEARKYLRMEICTYGHYDADERYAILAPTDVEVVAADWEPTQVQSDALSVPDKAVSKANESLRFLFPDTDLSFYGDAAWWLVASYG